MLEEKLTELTAAIKELTIALNNGAPAARVAPAKEQEKPKAQAPKKTAKSEKKEEKPDNVVDIKKGPTAEEVDTALKDLYHAIGEDSAPILSMLTQKFGAASVRMIDESRYQEIIDAAEELKTSQGGG